MGSSQDPLERLPSTLLEAQDYATSVIDLENTIVDKMNQPLIQIT